jgi:lysophospholipase L1-like esterase
MLDCLILGDSIAVGTHTVKQECVAIAKGGINTWQFNKNYVDGRQTKFGADVVVISLGSNDHKYVKTEEELLKLRSKIKAQRVYWILPAGNLKASEVSIQYIQLLIKEIAEKNGDFVIPIKRLQKDGIHPSWAGYKEISEQVK